MTCANNCKGVNPNAVVIGGTAILAAAAVTPLQVLSYTGLVAVTYNLKVRLSTGALCQVLQVGMGVATAGLGAAAIGQMVGGAACPATRPCNVRVALLDLQVNLSDCRCRVGETPLAECAADRSDKAMANRGVHGGVLVEHLCGQQQWALHT